MGKNNFMNRFKDKKIAVIGAGIEGVSSAKFLKKFGDDVTVLDEKIAGKNYLSNLSGFDMIIRSPGIKLNIPELVKAKEEGIEITSQMKLFFELCPAKIIGVTGTKGKGTTVSLIYEILKKSGKDPARAGQDAYLGGNIGLPPLDFLDKLNEHSIVVLEMSSYQLQDLAKSPNIAVILMMTQEHLAPDKKEGKHQNYHENLEEYIEVKRNILKFQTKDDIAIINQDYPASNESDIHTEGKVYKISREGEVLQGCFVKGGKIFVKVGDLIDEIIDSSDILLPGEHNLENVCAAIMTAYLSGVSKDDITEILKTFRGLEHRLELVGDINGVKYYDDSFSTTPETAIAAINAFKQPEILILGGASKGSDFTELGEVISSAKNIKAIIGIGKEWSRIKAEFRIQNLKFRIIENCKNMREIAQAAFDAAEKGDVVLLSPACSSFDMFKNYKVRGNLFKEEVRKLK